jgi:protein SCO1/2
MSRYVIGLLLVLSLAARADVQQQPFDAARIDERQLGNQVPLQLSFTDQHGQPHRLADLVKQRPTLLMPVYYRCPNVCGPALANLLQQLELLNYQPGQDYQLVVFSFDPRETPADALAQQQELARRWPQLANSPATYLLTSDAPTGQALAEALGFAYHFDTTEQQYAHSSAVAVLTDEGRLSRWLYGLGYQARDIQLALTSAGQGQLGSVGEQLLLLCFHYDPRTGVYSNRVIILLQVLGSVLVVAMLTFVLVQLRRDRQRRHEEGGHEP